jgi:4'-phosphopantetheinyl transferase
MSVVSDWSAPPPNLGLESDVHVWRAFLDSDPRRIGRLANMLSQDERDRASQFVVPQDRERFIAARAILRTILGRYSGRAASTIEFAYGSAGKPRMASLQSDMAIAFNVSHSGGLAVYAFARNREVGIDVELVRPLDDLETISERMLSQNELAHLRGLPAPHRHEAFFLSWTRKEAYLKAKGLGLGPPLDAFDFSVPAKMAERLAMDADHWTVCSFRPAGGYIGALVAEGKWDVQLFSFTDSVAQL